MSIRITTLTAFLFCALPFTMKAQCPPGEGEVTIAATTDDYGYETYWQLLPNGSPCGTNTIFAGGNAAVGCNGAGAQDQTPGGYLSNTTYTEGPWCLTLGATYDIFWADDWGDAGLTFEVFLNGVSIAQFVGTGLGETFSFVVEPPPARDMTVIEFTSELYTFAGAAIPMQGVVKSLGADVVTSFDMNYSVNGGTTVTENIGSVNLTAGSEYAFSFSAPWLPVSPGANSVVLWASNINGLPDLSPANDELTRALIVNEEVPNIIDDYLTGTPLIIQVANSDQDLLVPRDLDFHPDYARNELWVVNKDTEASGSSTVTFYDVEASSLQFELLEDGNNWHFMSLATGLAMGMNGNFATSPGVYDANHNGGDPFTGPSLWSADTSIYAKPSGGNGSHLDMLHQNPESQGIAHDHLNRYWVTDGFNGDVTMNDFMADHGPGNDDHTDAVIRRYQEFSITKDPSDHIVSHLVLDKPTGWLYVVDHGAARVMRLDINSGTPGGTPSWPPGGVPYESYVEYSVVTGYTWEEIISTGLIEPAGIDVIGDRLIVSDHANGDIVIYDISNTPVVELGRINTTPGIMGIKIGPDGRIWAVNATTHALIVIDPDGFSVDVPEQAEQDGVRVFPNPATDHVVVMLDAPGAGVSTLEMLDATGRLVRSAQITGMQLRMDVAELPMGMYGIRVTLENGHVMQERVVVAR